VVNKLADARLVTTGDAAGMESGDHSITNRTVTLAHERLLEAWPWLRRLVDEDRALILLKNEIEEDARRWDENRRDHSYLYRGGRLQVVEAQLQQTNLYLSDLALIFVNAGVAQRQALQQQEQTRAQTERRRSWQLPLAAIAVLALLLSAGWLSYRLWLRNQTLQSAPTVHFDRAAATIGEENSRVAEVDRLLRLNLPEFDLEIHEVTNAQYCRCKRAGSCKDLTYDLLAVCDPSIARLPVSNITLAQAQQYCQWLGRRLPTEIEWEWAARGVENRTYPTGNDAPIADQVNIWDGTNLDGVKWPVDDLSTDITPDGLLGMAGNVREWTLSLWLPYGNPDYLKSYWPEQATAAEGFYIARGGSFMTGPDSARSLSRYNVEAEDRLDDLGFRCLQGPSIQELEEEVSAQP
jgi:formylglycine-generating enzyme required for sulfatase activity